jgi:hypothetical protein
VATAAEQARTNLEAALVNATARLAEMDGVPLTERARMTYTEAGKTFGWNEFRAALVAQIRETKDLLAAVQLAAGPWEVRQVVR